jgi:uncharacterized membrane protein SpoIIM required for sporulation
MKEILMYLLIGAVGTDLLNRLVTAVDEKDKFTVKESLFSIAFWPLVLLICVHSFISGILESFHDD